MTVHRVVHAAMMTHEGNRGREDSFVRKILRGGSCVQRVWGATGRQSDTEEMRAESEGGAGG